MTEPEPPGSPEQPFWGIQQDAEKVRQREGKVKAQVKAEIQQGESSLNLDLDLSLPHSLRPCLGQGASLGEEAVLADSGRAGEVAARVGRVRSLAFLSILRAGT
jgi:hypothetical protein